MERPVRGRVVWLRSNPCKGDRTTLLAVSKRFRAWNGCVCTHPIPVNHPLLSPRTGEAEAKRDQKAEENQNNGPQHYEFVRKRRLDVIFEDFKELPYGNPLEISNHTILLLFQTHAGVRRYGFFLSGNCFYCCTGTVFCRGLFNYLVIRNVNLRM